MLPKKTCVLNTIRLGMSNARIEATNNKIKLIIRKAYGATPGYSSLTPIGAATAQYAYSFKGWL